jgi:hypothetical protein
MEYRVSANARQARPAAGRHYAQRGFSALYKSAIFAGGGAGVDWGKVRQLSEERCHMAIESHLAELVRRHQALEQEINEALAHPSADDLQIVQLKRKKLHVKDEMERLRHDELVH